MAIRHPLVGAGAAALAAAFLIPMLMQHEEKAAPQTSAGSDYFPFVRSLEGTHPDGDIKVTDGDALIADAELVRMFDYYLGAIGEKPLDAIRHEIELELGKRLKPRAATEGKRLLARYIEYKQALVELEKNPQVTGPSLDAMRNRISMMQQLRARFFSAEESKGMFGFEDAYNEDALARLEINQNKALTNAQKQEKFAALDAALPPQLREAREAPLKIIKLQESAEKLRMQGASEDDIYRMRAAALSPEAAARMAEVDQEDAAWKKRIAAYLAERSKLNDAVALSELRNRMFTPQEQRRLPAYER